MANLNVENLNRIVQTGDINSLMGGGSSGVGSTQHVAREMQAEGIAPTSAGDAGKNFSDILTKSVAQVNEQQVQSNTAISELVAGRSKNIHETMLTIERADTSLKLMMQVRNKILDAYREIMRMQV
jgi:flagellar hook-basal body complex protein FliE